MTTRLPPAFCFSCDRQINQYQESFWCVECGGPGHARLVEPDDKDYVQAREEGVQP